MCVNCVACDLCKLKLSIKILFPYFYKFEVKMLEKFIRKVRQILETSQLHKDSQPLYIFYFSNINKIKKVCFKLILSGKCYKILRKNVKNSS